MNTMSLEERVEVKENSEGVELIRVRGVYTIQSKAGVHVLERGVDGRVESQVIFSAFANSFTCGGRDFIEAIESPVKHQKELNGDPW